MESPRRDPGLVSSRRIVEQVADHLLEVLLLALELQTGARAQLELNPSAVIDAVERTFQGPEHGLDIGGGVADGA
jgi:hypothetical protein